MKDRIGIAIVALDHSHQLRLNCWLHALPGYSIVDSQSGLMQPTFSMYRDPQVQLDIGTIYNLEIATFF